jgi:RNA binding exosome subunit
VNKLINLNYKITNKGEGENTLKIMGKKLKPKNKNKKKEEKEEEEEEEDKKHIRKKKQQNKKGL